MAGEPVCLILTFDLKVMYYLFVQHPGFPKKTVFKTDKHDEAISACAAYQRYEKPVHRQPQEVDVWIADF